jgi:hypothetical protein
LTDRSNPPGDNPPAPSESPIFGLPDYKLRSAPEVGGLLLIRADGTSVCVFQESIPENAARQIAMQDRKIQSLFRETVSQSIVDVERYLIYRLRLDEQILELRRLVHGGAVADAFGPGQGSAQGAMRRQAPRGR